VALESAGAGLILVGAFVPWVRSHALFLTIPVNGVQTDYGRIFPFIALSILALLAYQWSYGWRRWAPGAVLLLAIAAIVLAVLYGVQIKHRVGRISESAQHQLETPLVLSGGRAFSVEFDTGYYLTLVGAGGVIVGTVLDLKASLREVP
jgi:hypothetical protein